MKFTVQKSALMAKLNTAMGTVSNKNTITSIEGVLIETVEDGKIRILPALPSEMKNGSIKGLLAKGNVKVDIEWENNQLSYLKLVTPIKQTAIINIEGADHAVELEANEEYIYAL